VIQLGIKECILSNHQMSGKNYEQEKLRQVLNRTGVLITECPKSMFHSNSVEQDLKRLLGEEAFLSVLRKSTLLNH
jgi:DNA mismatch repair protein MSH2